LLKITFLVAVPITVIPSRLVIIPPQMMSLLTPTTTIPQMMSSLTSTTTPSQMMSSLTPTISQSPTTGESSDDELSTGAAVGIIVGAMFVMLAGAVVIIGIFIRLVDTIYS